jgi:hypothetical protein
MMGTGDTLELGTSLVEHFCWITILQYSAPILGVPTAVGTPKLIILEAYFHYENELFDGLLQGEEDSSTRPAVGA